MNNDITTDNILRAAKSLGLGLGAEEAAAVRDHLDKQVASFSVLDSIDTENALPHFGLGGTPLARIKK